MNPYLLWTTKKKEEKKERILVVEIKLNGLCHRYYGLGVKILLKSKLRAFFNLQNGFLRSQRRSNWIRERSIKCKQLIMVFARQQGKRVKKTARFFFSICNPFPSRPSVAKGTYLQFNCTSRVVLNNAGALFGVSIITNMLLGFSN